MSFGSVFIVLYVSRTASSVRRLLACRPTLLGSISVGYTKILAPAAIRGGNRPLYVHSLCGAGLRRAYRMPTQRPPAAVSELDRALGRVASSTRYTSPLKLKPACLLSAISQVRLVE